jgi:hypothetical protein
MNDYIVMFKSDIRASDLFEKAFSQIRDPRSEAYKRGVLHALQFRLEQISFPEHPFLPGSAESDAYSAGIDEGHAIWRKHCDRSEKAT